MSVNEEIEEYKKNCNALGILIERANQRSMELRERIRIDAQRAKSEGCPRKPHYDLGGVYRELWLLYYDEYQE